MILGELFAPKKYEESRLLERLAVGWRRLLLDVSRAIASLSTGFPLTKVVDVDDVRGCDSKHEKREEGPEEGEGALHVDPG